MRILGSRGASWRQISSPQMMSPARTLWLIGLDKARFRTYIKSLVFWTLSVQRWHCSYTFRFATRHCKMFRPVALFWTSKNKFNNTHKMQILVIRQINTLNIYSTSLDNFRNFMQTVNRCAATGSSRRESRILTQRLPRLPRPVDTVIKQINWSLVFICLQVFWVYVRSLISKFRHAPCF